MLTIAVFLFVLQEYTCSLVLPSVNILEDSQLSSIKSINNGPKPEFYDWRDKNMVSPVKNQLNCNACWAFCVIANIESHLKIYWNVQEVLSEQFLIDCDDSSAGCSNASLLQTFSNIVSKFGGVLRDKDYYPYAAHRMQCRWERPKSVESQNGLLSFFNQHHFLNPKMPQLVPVIGYRRVFHDEDTMAEFIYNYGPLSAGINAASMRNYSSGIDEPTESNCNPKELDHAVLIVGYNVYVSKSGVRLPYWIIKNSWGSEWGDQGYYYMVRGRNACGIANDVSFAIVK